MSSTSPGVDGLSPSERSIRARLGAYSKWSVTADRTAATAAARQAKDDNLRERIRREVDPERKLPPAVLEPMVLAGVRAHYQRLALASARARRARKGASRET